MQIQLIWTDATTGNSREPVLETPVALGSEFSQMPEEIDGNQVSRMVLSDTQVSPYHALIQESFNNQLIIVDQNSSTGTEVNGVRLPSTTLLNGDRIRIGSFEIQVRLGASIRTGSNEGCDRMVGFLFKRRCGRTDSTGCPYCQGGQTNEDPYWNDYSYYRGYGRYDDWGNYYYYRRNYYYYNRETHEVDFTEADSEAFEQESDTDFEVDFGAS